MSYCTQYASIRGGSKLMIKLLSVIMTVLLYSVSMFQSESVTAQEKTVSQSYVEAMGSGWNLGNTFDGFDDMNDRGEESWGNPLVTRELIRTVKQKGFDSIRLPFTAHMRIGDLEEDYQIDEAFLDRYEEVVNWSLEEDLYVMINVHHDSWIWLAEWDGNTEAEEYIKFVRIWEQLADRFKDYDDRVMFESINEPQFHTDEASGMGYLERLNDIFHTIVRSSGGSNEERMLVLPTLLTDPAQNKLDALYNQIMELDDEHLIATIHYYSEWVYSANLGKTRFDGVLWDDVTPRTSLVEVFDRVGDTFTENGIGVVIGEYGLLGYDKSETVNQFGETLKFLEFINHYAREKDMTLMLWDNGQHLNRYNYEWYNPQFGEMIEKSMNERSSYATGLNTHYLTDSVPDGGLSIPLTLNGNEFTGMSYEGTPLNERTDYTYESETIHLSEDFLSTVNDSSGGEAGTEISLVMTFSGGADWHQTLVYSDAPVMGQVEEGSTGERLTIPTEYNGNHLENVTSRYADGGIVSNNNWWNFLEHGYEFNPDYEEGTIQLMPDYTRLLTDGMYELTFTFFNGDAIDYQLTVKNGQINGRTLTEEMTEEDEGDEDITDEEENTEEIVDEDNDTDDDYGEDINEDEDDVANGVDTEADSDLENNNTNTADTDIRSENTEESLTGSEDKSDTIEEGEKLPSTATSVWAIGVLGTGLLGLGSGLVYYNKKKK